MKLDFRHNAIIVNLFKKLIMHPLCSINPVLATKLIYRISIGKKLDLDKPETFNEKNQYLKLNQYYNNLDITLAVDKYRIREYMDKFENGKYAYLLNELVGKKSYKRVEDIELDELPDSFVLKCNHDSGSVSVCKNKTNYDWKTEKKKLKKALKTDFWKDYAETQYKFVPKCIIAEKYLEDVSGELVDYKFFCFNGEPRIMYCSNPDVPDELWEINYFDMNFQILPIHRVYTQDMKVKPEKPKQFEEMKQLAKILSKPFPFVRIDFFVCKERVYLGEFTFVPSGGLQKFQEDYVDKMLGEWLTIPKR